MLHLDPLPKMLLTRFCLPIFLLGVMSSQHDLPAVNKVDQAISVGLDQEEKGRYSDALKTYSRAAEMAHKAGDISREARAWLAIGSSEIDLHLLREALSSTERSYRLGMAAGNKTWAGGAAGNLAAIYRFLGEYSLAEKKGRESLNLLEDSTRKDFLTNTLIYLADLTIEQGRFHDGIAFSDRAIKVSRSARLPDLEAWSWDIRGFALLKANSLVEANDALDKAQAVRENAGHNRWLPIILGHRSELELKRGNYAKALRLNNLAFASQNETFKEVPAYYFVHVRAQILLALRQKSKALIQFRRAVSLANYWRGAALPGDATNIQTVVYLDEVYHDFAQLAAERALSSHDPKLAREAWAALAQNRAASLREQLQGSLIRDPTFGKEYLRLLSSLASAQARVTLGENRAQDEENLRSIRMELSELENQSTSSSITKERNFCRDPLRCIQAKLRPKNSVLLSFCFGRAGSYLWVITPDKVELHQLPNQAEIEQGAEDLRSALRAGLDSASPGLALTNALFGRIGVTPWQIHDWLITEDGALAGQIAYAALWDLSKTPHTQQIVVNHSLRVLPSELLLLIHDSAKPAKRFVGVADPIYNLADSRYIRGAHTAEAGTPALLGRLAGTAKEVEAAAKLSGMPRKRILSGREATGAALRTALNPSPELLHFAVHVVSPDGRPQEAALALSLTRDDVPELLTREAVATYRVPGSLVVLSGCASGQGKALPSSGLIGLSRAWLLAGAAAVVVSSWPIPDDSGDFFSSFYGHLQETGGSIAQRAATALERAQCDMRASRGYRSSPSFWAAYSVVSKE